MQVMEALPCHLAISVLQASQPACLKAWLQLLPEQLHQLILQAQFPSIPAERCLALSPCALAHAEDQAIIMPPVLKALGGCADLRSLQVGMFWLVWDPLSCHLLRHNFQSDPSTAAANLKTKAERLPNEHQTKLAECFLSMLQQLSQQLTRLEIGFTRYQRHCIQSNSQRAHVVQESIVQHCHAGLGGVLQAIQGLRSLHLGSKVPIFEHQELLQGLQGCTALERLSLEGPRALSCLIPPPSEPGAPSYPRQGPTLSRLAGREPGTFGRHSDVWGSGVITGRWALGAALIRMKHLRSLSLWRLPLTEEVLQPLKEVLLNSSAADSLQQLTHLSLQGCCFISVQKPCWHVRDFAAILQRLTTLHSIDLSGCDITSIDAKILAPAVRSLKQLRSIDLNENKMNVPGVGYFICSLLSLDKLSCLRVALNCRDEDCVGSVQGNRVHVTEKLAALICKLGSTLKEVNIAQLPVANEGVVLSEGMESTTSEFAKAFGKALLLESLTLECGGWSDVDAHALVQALGMSNSMQSLELLDCPSIFSGTTLHHFAFGRYISKLSGLTQLCVSAGVEATSAAAFAVSLPCLVRLQHLELMGWRVADKETFTLVTDSIGGLTKLTRLELKFPCACSRVSVPLGAALSRLLDLSWFGLGVDFRDLQGTGAGIEVGHAVERWGPEALGRVLAALPKLRVLNMADSALRKAGCVAIVEALVSAGRQLEDCTLGSVENRMVWEDRVGGSADVLNKSWVHIDMKWFHF